MDRPQGHKSLPSTTFGDNACGLGLAEVLRCAGDGHSLSGKRFAQQPGETGCDGIFCALERWVGFKDAFGQDGAKLTQIVEGRLHGDTSSKLSCGAAPDVAARDRTKNV